MTTQSGMPYLGLAPFLRISVSGQDLRPVANELLAYAQGAQDSPEVWMNLATVFFALDQREVAQSMQDQALAMRRIYTIPARDGRARLRLLVLAVPGDISENTPIDCLLENGDFDLIHYFASEDRPFPLDPLDYDAVLIAICDHAGNRPVLRALEPIVAACGKPVINAPANIPKTERSAASDLLQGVPGVLMPATRQVDRATLRAVAEGARPVGELCPDARYPLILRPVGSHGGHDLDRIADATALAAYLAGVAASDFYVSNFIDYSGADGLFRKCRVALVDGRPYACHMAASSNWMIHYVNAGMYEDAAKRAEERAFMENFAAFAERHATALAEIHRRFGMDYLCIDCAETHDGELLIFELDHAMVVHAMDPVDMFPYKQTHMAKVRAAVESLLLGRCGKAA